MATTSTRQLRATLASSLARVARGEEIVVTRRGKPYVRLVPAQPVLAADPRKRYPLRGTLRLMTDDFDAPMPGAWKALRK